jgi:hypothetical protein
MTLPRGSRLGSYEILALLGGGWGEVYRAHDPTLGRDVAIKILPDSWLADLDRLARFDREARILASLNHPHIGAIYSVDDASGVRALVLELVEGKVIPDSGPPQTIAETTQTVNAFAVGSWESDDTIFFTPTVGVGIWRISAAGGAPKAVTTLLETETNHRWPQLLPGGKQDAAVQRRHRRRLAVVPANARFGRTAASCQRHWHSLSADRAPRVRSGRHADGGLRN